MQCPESLSFAQNAVMRIFSRYVEVDKETEPVSSLVTERNITAQLIVDPNQVSCLIDAKGMISSDISTETGVEMQLSWGSIPADDAAKSDYILQVHNLTYDYLFYILPIYFLFHVMDCVPVLHFFCKMCSYYIYGYL